MGKRIGGALSGVLALIMYLAQRYTEVNNMITPENSFLLLWGIGILSVVCIALLAWGFWPSLRYIGLKIHKKGWVTCDKCGFIGVRNIKTRELEEMEDNQRNTGHPVLKRINSLGDTEPRHERIPECIMQAEDFATLPPLSSQPLPLFYMQLPRQCQHFIKWQKSKTPKEHINK